MKLGLTMKGLVLVSIPLLFQIGLMSVLFSIQIEAENLTKRIQRSLEIRSTVAVGMEKVATLIYKDRRKLQFNMMVLSELAEVRQESLQMVDKLDEMFQGDPKAMTVINEMRRTDTKCINLISNAEESLMSGKMTAKQEKELGVALREVMQAAMKNAETAMQLMRMAQSEIAEVSKQLSIADTRYNFTLIYGAVVELVLIAFSLVLIRKDIVNRINIVMENCYRLAALKPLHKPVGGSDEIAQIDRTYHSLFESLSAIDSKERTLLENAAVGILSLDERLSVLSANEAASKIVGLTSDHLVGNKLANLVVSGETQSAIDQFEMRKSSEGTPFELRIKHSQKGSVETLWTVRWSRADRVFFCVVHDNSRRKESERKRQTLITIVTDEIRRPLDTIAKLLACLKTGSASSLNERGERLLAAASLSSEQMVRLLGDLIEMENVESGSFTLHRSDVPLNPVLEQAVSSLAPIAKKREVVLEIQPGINCSIFADRDRITQVLINLLSNAIKYSPKGSTVHINVNTSGEFASISISDSGRGIPEAALATIFDPFKQVELSDSREKGGTGLGLAICRALVNSHGGEISALSKEGTGSIFTFTIPLRNEVTVDD